MGDLTRRLLMPSIYNLQLAALLDADFSVVGVDHIEGSDEGYRESLTAAMHGFAGATGGESDIGRISEEAWGWVRGRLHYHCGDFEDDATYLSLKEQLKGNCIFYLARGGAVLWTGDRETGREWVDGGRVRGSSGEWWWRSRSGMIWRARRP